MEIDKYIEMKTVFSTFLGAALVWGSDFVKSFLFKKKQRQYLAVRLIPVLDNFLIHCYDVAFDDGTSYGQPAGGEGVYKALARIPTLNFPDDVDWTSIDTNLLKDVMFLARDLEKTIRHLDIEFEYNEDPSYSEYIHSRMLEFAKYSLECDRVLTNVKKVISLPPEVYSENWNPREKCKEFISKNCKE